MTPGQLITEANVVVAAAVAFAAGIVSFASPCVVPLVPGYLSYMTGLSAGALSQGTPGARLRIVGGGILFTLGFAVPFSLLGLIGGTIAGALSARPWQVAMGVLVILLGLSVAGLVPFDLFGRERRLSDTAIDRGLLGALPLGFVFGVGWVPCIGPALAAIFTLSASTGPGTLRGGLLAFVYALGLGLPFICIGLFFHRAGSSLRALRRHAQAVQMAGGLLLSAVGVAIATGLWDRVITGLRPLIGRYVPPL